MKLYATITSERASKGQGGNKEIIVSLQAGAVAREKTYEIHYRIDGHSVILEVKSPYDNDYLLRLVDDYPDTKGKKQKGEKCYCSDDDMSIPHYH